MSMTWLHFVRNTIILFCRSQANHEACMLFKASAPGSLMLLGEYAVLQGKHAVVCAIDKRMTVSLSPRQDTQICLTSSLGQFETDLAKLQITPPFQFVLAALNAVKKHMKQGC